jgi:maltose O-acetyltransferase
LNGCRQALSTPAESDLMKSEKEKMLAGELYDPLDNELASERLRARGICRELNASPPGDAAARSGLCAALLGTLSDVWIEPPFHCDYGRNIILGRKVYFNFNCVVLDVMPVRIGSHTLFGPAVQIYTAMHPTDAAQRRRGLEFAKPVTIGDDVWVGGGVVICPGVSIGDRAVVGAGSVVTRDVPADAFAAGNPCRVIRTLELREPPQRERL